MTVSFRKFEPLEVDEVLTILNSEEIIVNNRIKNPRGGDVYIFYSNIIKEESKYY
jgi:hypothetical protein